MRKGERDGLHGQLRITSDTGSLKPALTRMSSWAGAPEYRQPLVPATRRTPTGAPNMSPMPPSAAFAIVHEDLRGETDASRLAHGRRQPAEERAAAASASEASERRGHHGEQWPAPGEKRLEAWQPGAPKQLRRASVASMAGSTCNAARPETCTSSPPMAHICVSINGAFAKGSSSGRSSPGSSPAMQLSAAHAQTREKRAITPTWV